MFGKWFGKPAPQPTSATGPGGLAGAAVLERVELTPRRLRLVWADVPGLAPQAVLRRLSIRLRWRRSPGAADQWQEERLAQRAPTPRLPGTWSVDWPAPAPDCVWVGATLVPSPGLALTIDPVLMRQLAHLLPAPGTEFDTLFAQRAGRIAGSWNQALLARQIVDDPGRPAPERLLAAAVQVYKAIEAGAEDALATAQAALASVQDDFDRAVAAPALSTPALMLWAARCHLHLSLGELAQAPRALADLLATSDRVDDLMTGAETLARAGLLLGVLQARDGHMRAAVHTLRSLHRLMCRTADAADPARLAAYEALRKPLQCAVVAGPLFRELERPTGAADALCARCMEIGLQIGGRPRAATLARLGWVHSAGAAEGEPA